MTELSIRNLGYSAGEVRLLRDISLTVQPGELVILLGPNGAGKTSLMRAALGLLKADSGSVHLAGRDLHRMTPMERARLVSYLPQMRPVAWPMPVHAVVALGRFAFGAASYKMGDQDREAVDRAMAACDVTHLADRAVDTLSGGELARVHVARALASETPLILADEPSASLDPGQKYAIMDLLRAHVTRGGGALVSVHDLDLAARYADRLVWIGQGSIIADGTVAETMTAQRLAAVLAVEAQVTMHEGLCQVVLLGRSNSAHSAKP